MTEQEFFERSLELSTEFDRYILTHPEVADRIPPDALLVFQLADDPAFSQQSLELARAHRDPNQPVVLVQVQTLRPPFESRLVNPRVEAISSL